MSEVLEVVYKYILLSESKVSKKIESASISSNRVWDHSKLPTLYWLPKLHKRPYKSRFIANSSACTTTVLSILLTSCLTAIKNHVIKYCTTVYERNGKNLFWSIKNSGEILNKLKSRSFSSIWFVYI